MKLVKSIVYVFFIVIPITIVAQTTIRPVCGTDEYYKEMCKKDPSILIRQQEADNLPQIFNSPSDEMATVNIIPVVFHIIHINGSENIPDNYCREQIRRLNEDYRKKNSDISKVRSQFKSLAADLNIEFRIARIDPQGKCTNGITRYYSDSTVNARDYVKSLPGQFWDSKKYLNIWVVSSIYNNTGDPMQRVLGYSYFPYMGAGGANDGVVMRADVVGYNFRTLTHEVGHFLGLYHTFQDGCINTNPSSNGDKISDTPPVAKANFNCDFTMNSCKTENPDQYDMVENYMDYTDCTNMFTTGQANRVLSQMQYYRSTLISTSNLQAAGVYDTTNYNCKMVANFEANQYYVCAGSPIKFTNTSYTSSTVQYIWEFAGGTPPVSFQKDQSVIYNSAGKYNVKLVVKNTLGKDSIIKQNAIVVYPQKGFNVPFYENFESATLTNDLWVIDPPVQNIKWAVSNKGASSGGSSFYVNNFLSNQKDDTISFTLPPINFTGYTAPLLAFRHAFAAKTTVHTDKLKVYVSDDCGKSWIPRYTKTQINLPTTQTLYTSEFLAKNSTLWASNQVDLSLFANKPNVLIKFAFITGLGNNLYIDDIRVGLLTNIEEKNSSIDDILLYPNPASKTLFLKLPENQTNDYSISIFDILGNELFVKHISENPNNLLSIDLQDAGISKNGTYLIRFISKDNIITKIFSVTD